MTANCHPCVKYHMKKAKELGVSGEEIAGAVAVGKMGRKGAAMKMDHAHEAPVSGIVTALTVSSDEQVPARRVIAEIQAGPELAKD